LPQLMQVWQTDLVSLGAGPYGHSGVYALGLPRASHTRAINCTRIDKSAREGGPKRHSVLDLRGIASVRDLGFSSSFCSRALVVPIYGYRIGGESLALPTSDCAAERADVAFRLTEEIAISLTLLCRWRIEKINNEQRANTNWHSLAIL
jgi:hypothetical protein